MLGDATGFCLAHRRDQGASGAFAGSDQWAEVVILGPEHCRQTDGGAFVAEGKTCQRHGDALPFRNARYQSALPARDILIAAIGAPFLSKRTCQTRSGSSGRGVNRVNDPGVPSGSRLVGDVT